MIATENKAFVELLFEHLRQTWAQAQSLDGVFNVGELRRQYCDTCNLIVGELLKCGVDRDDIVEWDPMED